jgi:uncharacterized protein YndB with AHSA1/START domain
MHTTLSGRSETRTITIDAPPPEVFALVADAHNLPRWAPAFARAVRPAGNDWIIVTSEDREGRLTVRASPEHGTVDLLATDDPRRGAFSRVLPNGHGSEYVFTLFFPFDTDDAAITRQMNIVKDELAAVRALCEHPRGGGAAAITLLSQ